MMRAFFIGITGCFCAFALDAQTVGKLRLLVDPGGDYQFVLDHKYRMQQREVELATGAHHFTFWAPERQMIDTVFNVMEGPTQDVLVRLPYSPEYKAYQSQMRRMKRDQWFGIILPSVATLGLGVFAGMSFSDYRKAHTRLVDDETLYDTSSLPSEIKNLKENTIPADKSDFNDSRTRFYIGAGLFTVAAAGTVYSILRTLNRPTPVFEDKEKLKFDGLVWVPGEDGGQWACGLHLALR